MSYTPKLAEIFFSDEAREEDWLRTRRIISLATRRAERRRFALPPKKWPYLVYYNDKGQEVKRELHSEARRIKKAKHESRTA